MTFKKGNMPWNKGLTGLTQISGSIKKGEHRSTKTQFKKGQNPWNKGLIGYRSGEKNNKWKGGKPKCLDCNKLLVSYYAKRCRACRDTKQSGSNSHMWKGGITPETRKIREGGQYSQWRTQIFKRDDYTCQWCRVTSGNGKAVVLHADHIKPFAYFPELRFELSNGRTLCTDCHAWKTKYDMKLFNFKSLVTNI